jgi:enoyl-CoA hydratase
MTWVELATPAEHVAVLTLARPPVNALNRAMREELVAAVDGLGHRDDIHVIVLTGSGPIFCAGADIKEKAELNGGDFDQTEANRLIRSLFFSVLESAKPVVGAINGAALGAGFVLASCCDILLAADDAVFAMPEIDVGQGGGASFLQRILPRLVMRKMMLTGERVPAAELHRLGVVDRVLPAVDLLDAAVDLASVIAAKSPLAVRTIRESFATVEELPLSEAFRIEQAYTTMLSSSPEAAAARKAFFDARSSKQ